MGLVKKRRFYVQDTLGNLTQVNPVNFNGKYVYERKLAQGQIFFRKKYSQRIDFTNTNGSADFTFFADKEYFDITRCNEFEFIVEVLCGTQWNEEFRGVFSPGQGFYDRDNCRFSVNVDPKDDYTCLLSNSKQQINLLDNDNSVQIGVSVESDFEFYVCRSSTPLTGAVYDSCIASRPEPADSWKEFFRTSQSLVNPPPHDYIIVWVRETAVVNCTGGTSSPPTGSGWTLQEDNCADTGTAVYVRQPLQEWDALNNPQVAYGDCAEPFLPPATVTFECEKVATPTDLTLADIIGPDFLRTTLVNLTASYFKRVPGNSVNAWTIENDSSAVVVSTSNPSQEEFVVTYNYNSILTDATFDVVCNETTSCGDVIEHRKTVTIRRPTSSTPGENTYAISGPRFICINQANQSYQIPEEYRSCISSVVWNVNDDYLNLDSSTLYTATVSPKGVMTPGTAFLLSAVVTTCEGDTVLVAISGSVGNAVATDAIQGPAEVCEQAEGIMFSVPARPGSTYSWTVDGGSIVSGDGTSQIVVDADGNTGTMTVTVKETVDCGCDWVLIAECEDDNPPLYWCFDGTNINYNGYTLEEAFDYVLSQIGCDGIIGVTSDFFEWNPQGDAPGYVPGESYVTGEANQYDKIALIQKSDARDPNASNPATVGKTTFEKMTQWLVEMFQVYWFIDGNRVRFEHISYFNENVTLDLTTEDHRLEMIKSLRYTYLNKELPKYERFAFAEAGNTDFIGDDIWYNTMCVNQDPDSNILEHNVPEITTDIQFVIQSPEDISKDGFVMLACEENGSVLTCISDTGELSGDNIANAPLSWANLHHNFYRHFRYWNSGYLNGNFTSFISSRPSVTQDPVELKMCCELLGWEPEGRIKTRLGDLWFNGRAGTTEKAEYDIVKEVLKLTIGYAR